MNQKINMDLISTTVLVQRVYALEAVVKELKRKLAEERANLSAYKQETKARGWVRVKPLGIKVTLGSATYNEWYIAEPTYFHVKALQELGMSVDVVSRSDPLDCLYSGPASKNCYYAASELLNTPDELVLHNNILYFKDTQ